MEAALKIAYLLAGSDRPKIDRAVDRLRARFTADAIEKHAAAEASGEDIVAACNALGLFAAGGRLVIVDGIEAWKAPDAKAIAGYLKEPAPATTLALLAADVKKDSAIAKAITAVGDVFIWDVPQRGLPAWVAEQFKLRGGSADPEACRRLIELVGNDLYELATEVDKLAVWANGECVTEAVLDDLVAPRAETSNFALTDAWGTRATAAVLSASEALLDRTGDPRSRTIPRVVGILTSHVGRIRLCQRLEAEGLSAKDAAARLKQHPFYVQKLYAQARNFSPEELRQVTVRLAELDHALKGGSRLAPDLELERALIDITARPDPGEART